MLTTLQTQLKQGAAALDLTLSDLQVHQLLSYLKLLEQWNRAFNLTAVRDIHTMLHRHILDSLSILPYLQGPRIIDVGTGAGLPGIPIAIMRPDCEVVLLDSNGKKIRFLTQVIFNLGLKQAQAIQTRVEAYQPEQPFNTVTTRAFATMPTMLSLCNHLLAPAGQLIAQKAVLLPEELSAIDTQLWQYRIVRLNQTDLAENRHLVICEKNLFFV